MNKYASICYYTPISFSVSLCLGGQSFLHRSELIVEQNPNRLSGSSLTYGCGKFYQRLSPTSDLTIQSFHREHKLACFWLSCHTEHILRLPTPPPPQSLSTD